MMDLCECVDVILFDLWGASRGWVVRCVGDGLLLTLNNVCH